jgi:hypothetical protein
MRYRAMVLTRVHCCSSQSWPGIDVAARHSKNPKQCNSPKTEPGGLSAQFLDWASGGLYSRAITGSHE